MLLQEAAHSGDIRHDLDLSAFLMFILGALNRSFEWYDEAQHISIDQLATQTQKLYLEGLMNRSAEHTLSDAVRHGSAVE